MYRGFELTTGAIYKNKNGGAYRCIGRRVDNGFILKNESSGWLFTAVNITAYDDGSIEWDYSTDGRFE